MHHFKLKTQRVVADMATSLLSEGYILRLKMESVSLMFYKLQHTNNGNTIVIKGYPSVNSYVMLKNGRQIKAGKII